MNTLALLGATSTRAGTLGSILATRLQRRGGAGIVTDGAYRDTPAIRDLGFLAATRPR